jgi:hypothetical protein
LPEITAGLSVADDLTNLASTYANSGADYTISKPKIVIF